MKNLTFLLLTFLISNWSFGQKASKEDLFSTHEPLSLKLDFSFKKLKDDTNDSTYLDKVLYFKSGDDPWDSIEVRLRRRGHFRLEKCYFPPVKVRIKKKKRKGTIFEDHKNLKLVIPCERSKDADALVVREYLCYQIYEHITPYSFRTRLTPIELIDHAKKKDRRYKLQAFLIEDDKRVAKRNDAEIRDDVVTHPLRLHDTTAVRHAMFQYLIANMDWSATYQHNEKIMRTENPGRNIPLAYDFDQAGFVNATYAVLNPEFERATVNPDLIRDDVRDRVYRGFCRNNDELMHHVRSEFLDLEGKIFEIIEDHKGYMEERDLKSLNRFIKKFYTTLKDDKLFKYHILSQCRKE